MYRYGRYLPLQIWCNSEIGLFVDAHSGAS